MTEQTAEQTTLSLGERDQPAGEDGVTLTAERTPIGIEIAVAVDGVYRAALMGPKDARRLAAWLRSPPPHR